MVTLASTDLTQQSLYVENQQFTVTPAPTAFTFANFVNPPNVKLSAGTTGGINSLSFTMADASHGGITLTLRAPSSLAQATYDTPITVKVYADSTGNILVDTFTVTLHYTVTNSYTVSGANGYTITALTVATNGLAGNAKQNVIYADVQTDSATQAYSVEALDPTTGAPVYPPVPNANSNAGTLALSDDGQYLYAGVGGNVERLKASGLTLDLTLPSGFADGVAVLPGSPHTVAVSSAAMQIFDDAVARPNSVPVLMQTGLYGSYQNPQWESQSAVYATVVFPPIGPPDYLCAFAVDSAGVTAPNYFQSCPSPNQVGADGVTFANGVAYSVGKIFDPTTWAVVGTYPGGFVTPDTTLGTGFAVVSAAVGGASCSIQSFKLSTGTAIASVRLPNVNGCDYVDTPPNGLVRFGANGIAIGTNLRSGPGSLIVITERLSRRNRRVRPCRRDLGTRQAVRRRGVVTRIGKGLGNSFLALTAALLSACGGNSGSSSSSGAQMTVSPSPVSTTAAVTAAAPSVNVGVTFANAPSTVYFMTSDYSTNGISSVSTPVFNSSQGSFTVHFKVPSGLKPATYADTDTLLLCSDPQCQTVLVKYSLAINYTVTPATSAPQVTLDSNTLSYQALAIDQAPVTATPAPTAFTFTNFTAPPFVKLSAPTTGGIDGLDFTMSDATHGGITFTFRKPSQLGAGTYTTPVTVTVCLDATCANQVATFALTVNYTIGNTVTVAGANGYTMTAVAVPQALALVGNAQQNVVYTSISSVATSDASGIEALNLLTGTTAFSAQPIGGSQTLALSDDGQYLYTPGNAAVQQVQTSNLTVSLSIPATGVDSIAVAPGEPQTIAVAGTEVPLQIFDKAVARQNALQQGATYWYDNLQWATDTHLYATYVNAPGPSSACNVPVDANGVSTVGTCEQRDAGYYNYANGLGYGFGNVVNTTNWNLVGTLTAPGATIEVPALPDATLGRVFAVTTAPNPYLCQLLSFDLATLAPIASLHLPSDSSGSCPPRNTMTPWPGIPVRWGTNGLALLANDHIIVIKGTFVGP
jgi:hypothetical protein